jgi:pimeloyl-ACP methyl ester carboxylesterase
MTDEDHRFVAEFIDSMFPLTPRVKGVIFDAEVSNADVHAIDLEAIRAPTLVAHTNDDPLASHEASRRAADRIPRARFLSLESGAHLMLGQTKILHDALADFLAEPTGSVSSSRSIPDKRAQP